MTDAIEQTLTLRSSGLFDDTKSYSDGASPMISQDQYIVLEEGTSIDEIRENPFFMGLMIDSILLRSMSEEDKNAVMSGDKKLSDATISEEPLAEPFYMVFDFNGSAKNENMTVIQVSNEALARNREEAIKNALAEGGVTVNEGDEIQLTGNTQKAGGVVLEFG